MYGKHNNAKQSYTECYFSFFIVSVSEKNSYLMKHKNRNIKIERYRLNISKRLYFCFIHNRSINLYLQQNFI